MLHDGERGGEGLKLDGLPTQEIDDSAVVLRKADVFEDLGSDVVLDSVFIPEERVIFERLGVGFFLFLFLFFLFVGRVFVSLLLCNSLVLLLDLMVFFFLF